jgi:predicted ATP-grasp superfamily ATP-dependent carboligase
MTGDKARLAEHFANFNIPSPPTRMVDLPARELPGDWEGSIVVKPRDGAGSVDTTIVKDRRCPDWVTSLQSAIVQPYLPGSPMSASFLVDVAGRSTLLGVGKQRIAIDRLGNVSYQGGTILADVHDCPGVVESAINSVNETLGTQGLRGWYPRPGDQPEADDVLRRAVGAAGTGYDGRCLAGRGGRASRLDGLAWSDSIVADWP